MLKIIVSFIILSFSNLGLADTLDKAQSAYEAGKYSEARTLYLQYVEASNPNASVFHNLGLAFDRENALGPAVASYLRAVQLQPRQADALYNLHFLLGKASDKLDSNFSGGPLDPIWAYHYASEREIYYAGLTLLVLASLLAAYGILRSRFKNLSLGVSALLFLGFVYGATSLVLSRKDRFDLGAVSVPKVEAYSGPTQSVVIFELHEGAPFQIVDSSGDWVKIELSDQKKGWIKKESITSFGSQQNILPAQMSQKS